jgi:LysR family glycine cleavage system transcriptional activator
MQHSQTHLRTRPISAGHLRAFEAVARHLNFRAASEEMALTQSAVSRQIQSLEEEVGVSLFLRHTRAVELTSAGAQLLLAVHAVAAAHRQRGAADPPERGAQERVADHLRLVRLDVADPAAGGSSSATTPTSTSASTPDDVAVDLDVADVDLALRYGPPRHMPPQRDAPVRRAAHAGGQPLAAEERAALKKPADLAQFTLIEAGDAHQTHLEWLTWRRWFDEHGPGSCSSQALAVLQLRLPDGAGGADRPGRGAGALPLIAESLANGDLVEPLPQHRMDSPMAYWLIVGPRSAQRPEIRAFCDWLQAQAASPRADHRRGARPGHGRQHGLNGAPFCELWAQGFCVLLRGSPPPTQLIGQTTPVVVQDGVQRHVVRLGLEVGRGSRA